jgi:hypothetical protein
MTPGIYKLKTKKTQIRYTFLLLLLSFLLSSCYDCYDCIGPGQNASSWLIYENNELVIFRSQTNEIDTFYARKYENPPAEEYCGRIGSESYGACNGDGSAYLYRTKNDNYNDFFLWLNIIYGHIGEVESKSSIHLQLNKMYFYCNNTGENSGSYHDTLQTIDSYLLNGKNYEHVFHCTVGTVDSTVTVTEFYYQKEAGLLKYIEKDGDSWSLKEN